MRINSPKSYIDWLHTVPAFRNGELKNLPKSCIVLHDSLVIEHLTLLHYGSRDYKHFKIGATDPIEFYVVREMKSSFEFIIMCGLPGAGGISTQVSEMSALGCNEFFHVGTCGLLDTELNEGVPILSIGSQKDEAAKLLSDSTSEFSNPSQNLFDMFETYSSVNRIYQKALGVTIPIFYHQPEEFIKRILQDSRTSFIEMEQAVFFETCHVNKVDGISIVAGSDRYIIKDGKIKHFYYDLDQNRIKNDIVRWIIEYLKEKATNNRYDRITPLS